MQEIILFIFTFLIVYIIYQIFIVRKEKRRNSKKRPPEVNFLIYKYNIDIKKLDYHKMLNTISIISSLDITIIVTIISTLTNFWIQLIVALVLIFPIFLISYYFIGKYYIKKGYVKDV